MWNTTIFFSVLMFVVAVRIVQHRDVDISNMAPVELSVPALPYLEPNDRLRPSNRINVRHVGEGDLIGPESLVVYDKYLFATLADGRIVRMQHENEESEALAWQTVAMTGTPGANCGQGGPSDSTQSEELCGRPLGLRLVSPSIMAADNMAQNTKILAVADAYKGLLAVDGILPGETGKITQLDTSACGELKLINDLVQTEDGTLYFTETSTRFQRRRIFYAMLDGRPEGRLLAYRRTEEGEEKCVVVMDNLFMPNGITVSHDKKSLIIVSGVQVVAVDLAQAAKAVQQKKPLPHNTLKPFISVLPGTGDNIRTFQHLPNGTQTKCYWLGLGSKYAQPFSLIKTLAPWPQLRWVMASLIPYEMIVGLIPKYSMLAVYDEHGRLIETLQDPSGYTPWISEAEMFEGRLVLGSWYNQFLTIVESL
eukprot:m.22283 g.22283  ORF g.22283 m.22283 type:complete len:423 (-) comp7382_c0_seq1:70-1338(-)